MLALLLWIAITLSVVTAVTYIHGSYVKWKQRRWFIQNYRPPSERV